MLYALRYGPLPYPLPVFSFWFGLYLVRYICIYLRLLTLLLHRSVSLLSFLLIANFSFFLIIYHRLLVVVPRFFFTNIPNKTAFGTQHLDQRVQLVLIDKFIGHSNHVSSPYSVEVEVQHENAICAYPTSAVKLGIILQRDSNHHLSTTISQLHSYFWYVLYDLIYIGSANQVLNDAATATAPTPILIPKNKI